jgi:hypothetical protein
MRKKIMNSKLTKAISAIDSTQELNEAIRLIKQVRKQVLAREARDVKSWIRVGMKVKIKLPFQPGPVIGIVNKVKIKKALVSVDGEVWNAPLTMIEAA